MLLASRESISHMLTATSDVFGCDSEESDGASPQNRLYLQDIEMLKDEDS